MDRGGRRQTHPVAIVAVALLAIPFIARAANAGLQCQAAKIDAAGFAVFARARCYERAKATGQGVNPSCLANADARLFSAFDKAEATTDCANTAHAAKIQTAVDLCATRFSDALGGVESFPGCARLLTAVGRATYAASKCQRRADLHGTPIDPACIAKARAKLDTAAAKLDAVNACPTSPSSSQALQPEVDACLASLAPACVPVTCADAGRSCGTLDDLCGAMVNCGTCTAPEVCGGSGVVGQCGPLVCAGRGRAVGGSCWFVDNYDCDTTCPAFGRVYDDATRTYAGSDGTSENCQEVAEAFYGAPEFVHDTSGGGGFGCGFYVFNPGLYVLRDTDPTTGILPVHGTGFFHFCACR